MKRKASALFLLIAILALTVAWAISVNLATANIIPPVILPEITINSNGFILPQTELISKDGNIYTLTADIQEQPIVIACSNIVFDGAGHAINITEGDNPGLSLKEVNNVVVKNLTVYSRNMNTINFYFSNSCLITGVQTDRYVRIIGDFNNITESNTGVSIFTGSNNLIEKNNISELFVGHDCYNNRFFRNNFYLTDYPELVTESIWDNGSIGNYWSNYTTKYLNASEVGSSGIGDTPHFIDRGSHTTKDYPNQKNIDHYPLMYPFDIEKNIIAFPTPNPATQSEPFPTTLVIAASVASAGIVAVGLLVYFKKRKASSNSSLSDNNTT
jgi:hypothetical protein